MTDDILGLSGKVALVTGGGAGIGRATAELLAKAGMGVAVAEIDPDRAQAVRATLENTGADVIVIEGDMRVQADVEAVIAAVRERFGRLDVLVNNIGDYLGYKGEFSESDETEWQGLYEVNLLHMFRVTKAALPLLKAAKGGSVVNLSTVEAFRGIPLSVVYSAFKAAVTGFTQSLAVELGQYRIRVNAVAPETTDTAQIAATTRVPAANRDYLDRWFPIGRFGAAADSAGAVLFLASEALSGWVSGATIPVDGGALAAGAWMRLPAGGFTHLPIIVADGYDDSWQKQGKPGRSKSRTISEY